MDDTFTEEVKNEKQKMRRDPNASDIEALKKGIEQLNAGRGIVKTTEELAAMENG